MRLIDAEDFLDLFYVASAGQDRAFVETVEMVIEDTPTADVAPVVHARLELKGLVHRCSACGQWYGGNMLYRYCPFCGALMDGERRNDAAD